MRCAVVQFTACTDVDANLEAIRVGVLAAADRAAGLVVMPEASMHDFGPPHFPLGRVAQPLDGPFVTALAALADESGAMLIAGMFETSDDPARPYNTVVVCSPGAGPLATYRKLHLYDSFGYRESDRMQSGDGAPITVKTDDLVVGVMTCYDLRFPEMARSLVDAGSEVLAVPAAWLRGPLKEEHWTTLLSARAIENTCYVVAAGQNGGAYVGRSTMLDPMGVPVASLGEQDDVLVADLAPERLAAVRRTNPSLENRRLRSAGG